MPAIVTVCNVEKSFPLQQGAMELIRRLGARSRRVVLHGVSFEIRRGELFGLLGPNGAGKTTLLKLLATLLLPERGSITLDGFDVVKEAMQAKRRIGLCASEERSFYYRLSARENLEYFGAMLGLRGDALRRSIGEVLNVVNLSSAIERRFDSFSSGMRQRLTVARALLADPPILFFDEPTRAVDPVNAEEIRTLIRDELVGRRGKTVVLATNLLHEAWELADRIAVVNHGTIVALDTPKALTMEFHTVARYHVMLDELSEETRMHFADLHGLRSLSVTQNARAVEIDLEIEPSETSLRALMQMLGSPDVRLRELRSIEPAPMEIFKHVTQIKD